MRKRNKRKEWIKLIIAIALMLFGIVGGYYVGEWLNCIILIVVIWLC